MRGSGPVIGGVVLPKQGPSHSDFKRGMTNRALQEKVEEKLWEAASQPQIDALECAADILLFGGSAGGLKTETLLVDAAAEKDNPNLHAIIFRETFPELRDIVLKSRKLYPGLGGRFVDGSPKKWVFPSGATIEFGYLGCDDDVYAHQGQEYSFIGFDEAGHQNEFRIRYLLTRLRSTDPTLKLRLRLTANPGGQGHDFLFKFFLRGVCPHCTPGLAVEDGKLYTDAVWPSDKQPVSVVVEGELIEFTVAFIRSKITDHNLLGKRYVANLMQQSAATANILLSGCWKQWEGQYFDCYVETRGYEFTNGKLRTLELKDGEKDLRMLVPHQELDIKPWYAHIVGGDYGFTISKAAGVLIARTPATPLWPNGRMYVIDEYLEGGVTARDYGKDLVDRWFLEQGEVPEKPRSIQMWVVSPDAQRKDGSVNDVNVAFSRLQQMNESLEPYGFEFIRANDDRVSGWTYLYQILRDGELVICNHCENTRNMFLSRIRDPKRFDDLLKVPGDELDDLADALRYAVMTWKLQGTRPRQERVQEIIEGLDPTSRAIAIQRFEKQESNNNSATATIGKGKAKSGGMGRRRPW